jgi:hypothetical protein
VTIDGVHHEIRDLYASGSTPTWHVEKRYENLGLGWHQIHLAVEGTTSGSDTYIDMDELIVIP